MTTQRFSSDAEVRRIGEGLIDRTLPKPEWTHAAHFAAAVYLVAGRPDIAAERDMPDMIRTYNLATGVENTDIGGYHETITRASLHVVRHVLADLPIAASLHDRTNAVLDAGYAQKDWLLRHWRRESLFSVTARRGWVPPDLEPLP
jgi:hypothetical protein